MLERLTPEQERLLSVVRDEWLRVGLSTEPADRAGAEAGVRLAYQTAGLPSPRAVIWLDSPLLGVVAAVMLEPAGVDQWERARTQLRARAGEQVWARVRALVQAKAGAQVWQRAGGRTSSAVWEQVVLRACEQVNRVWLEHVAEPLYGRVFEALWEVDWQVWRRVALQVRLQLVQQLEVWWSPLHRPQSWIQVGPRRWEPMVGPRVEDAELGGGQHLAAQLSMPAYFAQLLPGLAGPQPLQGLMLAARSAGWWWLFDDVAVLTERPRSLHRDDQGRLHHPHGAAIGYPDGWGVWAWHGVRVPRGVIAQPETLTVQRIRDEANLEIRRVMLERYGQERYLRDADAQRVHADQTGVLWRCELPDDDPLVMVQVRNATPEPDGSRRSYWLRVPPDVQTARQAVAWTFGLGEGEYTPAVET